MINEKILETRIDLFHPSEIYSPNIDKVIISKIRQKYKGKCYKSCYIIEIVEILRKSNVYMSYSLNGSAYVDVMFKAQVLIYYPGEIIPDAKIINKDTFGMVLCQTDYASIQVDRSRMLDMLGIGRKTPVIVYNSIYSPNEKTVTVIARSFKVRLQTPVICIIGDGLTSKEQTKLSKIFEQIEDGKKWLKSVIDDKRLQFFNDLLYPFKQKKSLPDSYKSLDFKKVDLSFDSVKKLKNGIICRPAELSRIEPVIYHSNADILKNFDKMEQLNAVQERYITIMERMANDFLVYVSSLKSLMNEYKDLESVKEHLSIFKSFMSTKR